jgi:prefoldin subunit 5
MDAKEIKRQMEYWEAEKRLLERQVKAINEQIKLCNDTVKLLKKAQSLDAPKETYSEVDYTNPDEVNPV